MRRAAPLALLLAVAALAWGAAEAVRLRAWTTGDEPDHVLACRELRSGPGVVSNFEHPVLMKVLGAAGLAPEPAARNVDEVRAARRAFPFLFALLPLASGVWAWRRSGLAAGLLVAGLVAVEPTFRAHAALVHSDVLLATALVAAAAVLDLAPRRGRAGLAGFACAGLLYGVALVSKYSALPFLGAFAVAAVARSRGLARLARPEGKRQARKKRPAGPLPLVPVRAPWVKDAVAALVAVALPALAVAALVQQGVVAGSTTPDALRSGVARKFEGMRQAPSLIALADSLPRGAAAYAAGLGWVRASSVAGARPNYFLGEVSGKGFPAYFVVALALKLTFAAVALLAGALAAAVFLGSRWRTGGPGAARRLRLLAVRSALPAFLGLAYLGAATAANVNIGVRHVLPAVPLLLVAAAGLLRTATAGRRRLRHALVAAVLLLAALEAGLAWGREVPFGNLLAGGPAGTHRFLSDSNADWGEAQGRVFERVARGDLGRVGIVALAIDEQELERLGMALVGSTVPGQFDTVFVSIFLDDVGRAAGASPETTGKVAWLRGWLTPLLATLDATAVSRERLGDEYVVYRLRPAVSAPPPASPTPPG